jgi:hypothetical protein
LEVRLPADPVVGEVLERVIEEAVDREVTSQGISPGAGKRHLARMAAVLVVGLRSEGGHLKLLSFLDDNDDAELLPDGYRPGEELLNLVWFRRCGDIIVVRFATQENVSHTAANPISFEP